ncbi:uncharacterized protein LOC130137509 [Syzygium oleosum]|uniref:uncharacterized protein LOC130137509 n=1 Tax=Syzygium oleosum TaxID=219896 RepID=UPI0024B8B352|nr:uncharacterized protein LOC130137509 [Syzygium oleosum]
MAAPDPNARPTVGKRYPEDKVDKAHNLIEKCIQLYMDRDETAHALEIHFRIDSHLTRMVWDKLEESNQEFFQNYYTRLALKRQIGKINELLEQQHLDKNFPLVPAEQQMSMKPQETAPLANSPVSKTSNENEAESSSKLPANPVSFVGSEEVVGSDLLIPSGSLTRSSLENAALDTAHMPISRVPNLIAGGHHTANLRGPVQPSSSMAQSLSHLDSNPQASNQKDLSNFASGQGSQSADR